MSSNNNGLAPVFNKSWDIFNQDWFSEDCTIKVVSDGTIGTLPHLLQLEFLDSSLIRSDGSTLDSNLALFNEFS